MHALRHWFPILVGVVLITAASAADAGRVGGGGHGGGRVSRTSAGVRGAASTSGGGGSGSSGSHSGSAGSGGSSESGYRHSLFGYGSHYHRPPLIVTTYPSVVGAGAGTQPTFGFDLYAGMQKVYESDYAMSLEAALLVDRARINVNVTSYQEQLADGGTISLNIPSITLGLRVTDPGPTRLYVEAGGTWLVTNNDPVMNTTLSGATGGIRIEHVLDAELLGNKLGVLADIRGTFFEADVRAVEARVGMQLGYLRASVRTLDTNVGPALFGPELGLGLRF